MKRKPVKKRLAHFYARAKKKKFRCEMCFNSGNLQNIPQLNLGIYAFSRLVLSHAFETHHTPMWIYSRYIISSRRSFFFGYNNIRQYPSSIMFHEWTSHAALNLLLINNHFLHQPLRCLFILLPHPRGFLFWKIFFLLERRQKKKRYLFFSHLDGGFYWVAKIFVV